MVMMMMVEVMGARLTFMMGIFLKIEVSEEARVLRCHRPRGSSVSSQ